VVLLSRDNGLASIVGVAVANGDRVAHIRSTSELADWSEDAVAAVVLDSRPHLHRQGYKQVRDRYRGPLVMLLDRGERHPSLPPDGARRFLYRPFSAADVAAVLGTPPPKLGTLETAVIDAWSRHAGPDAAKRPAGLSYRVSWGKSARRRLRAWAWTVAAMVGVLLVFSVSDQSPCGPGCTRVGAVAGAVAGASESPTPLTAQPLAQGGDAAGGGGQGGQSATPPSQPGPGGVPLVSGIGGLIDSISPVTAADPTPPAPPEPVPGVPSPTPPPTTAPPTTAPPTTAPPTTAPPTTAPPTTAPPTTAPPTTEPPTTAPPTTEPPTTQPPATAAPTTEPPTTAPPTP
jgi:outer membrane biosynthesis protein TonB